MLILKTSINVIIEDHLYCTRKLVPNFFVQNFLENKEKKLHRIKKGTIERGSPLTTSSIGYYKYLAYEDKHFIMARDNSFGSMIYFPSAAYEI